MAVPTAGLRAVRLVDGTAGRMAGSWVTMVATRRVAMALIAAMQGDRVLS